MKRLADVLRQISLGVLLAALLLPLTVRAQWTVFDPANYGVQIRNQIDSLTRWIETIQQYTQMYENAVSQLTSLQGILKTADELFTMDRRLRTLLSSWGQAVRLVFRVKNQLASLVTGAARAVLNIEQRLRQGIFDPAANQRDFAEYLRSGIGRTAQDAQAEVERLQKMDNQLERLAYDHEREAEQLAQLNTYLTAKREELERLKNCDDCTDKDRELAQLSLELAQLEEKAARAEAEVSRLFDLKARRVEEIYRIEEERTRFGRQVTSLNDAWRGITEATLRLREKLQHAN